MLSSRSLNTIVLAAALMAGGCDRQSEGSAQPQAAETESAEQLSGVFDRSAAGRPLPDFTLTDAAGKTLPLSSLKGKPLLINLWATWCAPCIVELPMLNDLARDRQDDLRVLTVSQDMSNTDAVAPFLAERGLDRLEPWLDPQTDLTFELGATTLPTTILYDAQGREVWRFVGAHDWTSAEAAEMLREGLTPE